MKFVDHHFPGLVRPVTQESLREENDGLGSSHDEERLARAPESTRRGLAVYIEPEMSWMVQRGSPWDSLRVDNEKLAALSQIAFIGGTHVEATELARQAKRYCGIIKKPKPVMFKRLWQTARDDDEDLAGTAEEFDGLLVPPHSSTDMAVSYEYTRRRIAKLIDKSLLSGWTRAPLIALESPSPVFSERVTRDFIDVLVPEDAPQGAHFNAPQIAVPVKEREFPWWISSDNYFYCLKDKKLWYSDWMINPLTFTRGFE